MIANPLKKQYTYFHRHFNLCAAIVNGKEFFYLLCPI